MLIEELLGEDGFAGDVEIQNSLEDILVQLHHQGIKSVGLNDIAGELSKAVGSVQVNPDEPDFLDVLRQSLEQNKWVSSISPTGQVILKQSGEEDDEAKKDISKQDRKLQKIASKNLKQKNKTGEL